MSSADGEPPAPATDTAEQQSDPFLSRSVTVTAGLVAIGSLVAAMLAGPLAAANLATGGALSLALLLALQWAAGRWRRARRVQFWSMAALLLPKYSLIALGLYFAVRGGYFRPWWFLGGYLALHAVWLLQAGGLLVTASKER